MRFARIAFASLFAVLAALLVCDQILLIREHGETHVLEHVAALAAVFCCAASSVYYFRPRAYWDARLACPNCKDNGSLRLSSIGQPRISIIAWILGGFIGSLLYSHARKHRFRCASCSEASDVRTIGGWLAAAWLLLLVLALATAIYIHRDS
jgi:hypothetical protein